MEVEIAANYTCSVVWSPHMHAQYIYTFFIYEALAIYIHNTSPKNMHISPLYVLRYMYHLGCCNLHVWCQLLPTLYHGKPSEYVLS